MKLLREGNRLPLVTDDSLSVDILYGTPPRVLFRRKKELLSSAKHDEL